MGCVATITTASLLLTACVTLKPCSTCPSGFSETGSAVPQVAAEPEIQKLDPIVLGVLCLLIKRC